MSHFTDLSDEQLAHRVMSTERELVAARFRHSMNQLENTASLRDLRRDVARLRTEARRREAAQGLMKDALIASFKGSFQRDGSESEAPAAKGGFLSGLVDKLSTAE